MKISYLLCKANFRTQKRNRSSLGTNTEKPKAKRKGNTRHSKNNSRQLKSYHATREESFEDPVDLACFETSGKNDDHNSTEKEMDVDESRFDYFEGNESAINTTSSMDDSDESSSRSQNGSSQSEC